MRDVDGGGVAGAKEFLGGGRVAEDLEAFFGYDCYDCGCDFAPKS